MAKTARETAPAEAPGQKAERKPAKESKGPRKPEIALRVRYRKVMRPQRTYSLTVEVPRSKGKEERPAPLVVVRAIIPGALVSPAEQRLDLAKKGEKINFFVTPLSRGLLPRARLEIYAPGQPVQLLPLKMRSATQRKTWVLLLLTLLVPWGLSRLVFGPGELPTFQVQKSIEGTLMRDLAGIPFLSQKWPDAPDYVPEYFKSTVFIPELANWIGLTYTYLYDWIHDERGLAWIVGSLGLLTILSWLWHRCWRGGRILYLPLPDSVPEEAPRTLEPLA